MLFSAGGGILQVQYYDVSFLYEAKRKGVDPLVTLLAKFFIPNRETLDAEALRGKYGMLCGALGIVLNVLLCVGKLLVGLLSGAISVVADAFNNLSDAGSSLITMLGFKLAGQKPDPDHPFGHGRIEYISGLLVSILIVLVGFELGKSSVEKILHPEDVTFSLTTIVILAISVAVKLYMTFYNRNIGKRIGSPAMEATAADSLSDSVATTVVLLCMLVSHWFSVNIDAYCGLAVSAFILFSGFRSAKETVSPLLGQPPSEELVTQIGTIVRSAPSVCGIHDLVVHDYGPGRLMISLHAEVPATSHILDVHDEIDNVEKRLRDELRCEAVIHMDPLTTELRHEVATLVQTFDPSITVHDFRVVRGNTHTNVIFDAVVPFSMNEKEAAAKIAALVKTLDPSYFAVVNIDRSLVK